MLFIGGTLEVDPTGWFKAWNAQLLEYLAQVGLTREDSAQP